MTEGDLRNIAQIMASSQADIVCIQELMTGHGVEGQVDSPISQASIDLVQALRLVLATFDPKADWRVAWSGVNSGKGRTIKRMRDAYAFLLKGNPAHSANAHPDPVAAIQALSEPIILRQPGNDNFKGRRPGMLTVNVLTDAVTPINIISFHAATPCNAYSKGKGAGYSIAALATLPEIGGGMLGIEGSTYVYRDVMPLPQIDTIVLGDFNYTMDDKFAPRIYQNLLTNYTGCVSRPDSVHKTTYETTGTNAFGLISAYDNIFVLNPHSAFKPALKPVDANVIDFIKAAASELGPALGFHDAGTGIQAAWYVIHQDQYKKQHAVRGISDHLPVWAEFEVGNGQGRAASHILPTSGADNNCLFHALFGADAGGILVDPNAATHRNQLGQALTGYRDGGSFPSAAVRTAVLQAMINQYDNNALALDFLRPLLDNNDNPFGNAGFIALYNDYLGTLAGGRMIWIGEAALVAILGNFAVNLHFIDRGQFRSQTLNEGAPNPRDIFHQSLHFARWQP